MLYCSGGKFVMTNLTPYQIFVSGVNKKENWTVLLKMTVIFHNLVKPKHHRNRTEKSGKNIPAYKGTRTVMLVKVVT